MESRDTWQLKDSVSAREMMLGNSRRRVGFSRGSALTPLIMRGERT